MPIEILAPEYDEDLLYLLQSTVRKQTKWLLYAYWQLFLKLFETYGENNLSFTIRFLSKTIWEYAS